MTLPADLQSALDALAQHRSAKDLAAAYRALSDRYRRLSSPGSFRIESEEEALAYALARMPATYEAVANVLGHLRETLPGFAPDSILDIGAGPGTAALAALSSWSDIGTLTLIEPNSHLRKVAQELLPDAIFQPASLDTATLPPSDLVLASYVLNETDPARLDQSLDRLWDATTSTLVLIEPGTPLGYSIILKARAHFLAKGARIAAPCPHHHACPLAGADRWCHFATRVNRSHLHRLLKDDATLNYEDEKFSYLVVTREAPSLPAARLIGHPHGSKLVTLELCEANGEATTRTYSKRDAEYKHVKKLNWGDRLGR